MAGRVIETDWKVVLPSKISIFGQKPAFAQFGCTLFALRISWVGARMVTPPCPFRAKTPRKRCVHPARSWRRRGGHWQRLRGSTTQHTAPNGRIFAFVTVLSHCTGWTPVSREHKHCAEQTLVRKKKCFSPIVANMFFLQCRDKNSIHTRSLGS